MGAERTDHARAGVGGGALSIGHTSAALPLELTSVLQPRAGKTAATWVQYGMCYSEEPQILRCLL